MTSDTSSIVGKWTFIGWYVNNQLFIMPIPPNEYIFSQNNTYLINSIFQDSTEYGTYAIGRGQYIVNAGSLQSSDSIVLNHGGQSQTSYYQIKGDTLFFLTPNSSTEATFVSPDSVVISNFTITTSSTDTLHIIYNDATVYLREN